MFHLWRPFLGDQWAIGDWDGMRQAAAPSSGADGRLLPARDAPPQNLKEYDPEWGRAFWTGTVAARCDHARMLASVKVPVLLTHHFRQVDEQTGQLMGALSDLQAAHTRELIVGAGQSVDYRSFPEMGHSMHGQDPQLFADTLIDWTTTVLSG